MRQKVFYTSVLIALCLFLTTEIIFATKFINHTVALKQISQQVTQINKKIQQLTPHQKILRGYSAEGAQLNIYYLNKEPLKVHVIFYGEKSKAEESYYFAKNQIIFFSSHVKLNENRYRAPLIIKQQQEKIYINNAKIILWTIGNNTLTFTKHQLNEKVGMIQADVKEYLYASQLPQKEIERSTILRKLYK